MNVQSSLTGTNVLGASLNKGPQFLDLTLPELLLHIQAGPGPPCWGRGTGMPCYLWRPKTSQQAREAYQWNMSQGLYSACGHLLPGIPTVRVQPELLSTYLQVNKMLSLATSFSVRTILVMPQVCVCLFPNTLDCYLCTSRVSGQRYLLSIHAQD